MLYRVRYHKQQVQNLTFSCNDQYLVSLGGLVDVNQVACWNMGEGKSEAVQFATDQVNQECTDIKFFNRDPTKFISVHNNAVKFWRLDPKTSRFSKFDVQLGQIKRRINCVAIDDTDTYVYCGTRSGDIIEVIVQTGRYKRIGPVHKIFQGGINAINCFFSHLIVGS